MDIWTYIERKDQARGRVLGRVVFEPRGVAYGAPCYPTKWQLGKACVCSQRGAESIPCGSTPRGGEGEARGGVVFVGVGALAGNGCTGEAGG